MVYDISGKLVATFFGSNVLKLPSKGAYVVKNKQMAEKVIVGTSIYSFESVIILRFTIEKATGVFFTPTRLFFICLIYLTLACEVIESLPLRGNL